MRDVAIPPRQAVTTQDQALANLRSQVTPRDRATIKQSAEDFEALFLNIVLKSMRDTVQKSGLVDGGNAENIYSSLLDDEYAKMMAGQRHTGLADHIEAFLLTAQASSKPLPGLDKGVGMKAYQGAAAKAGLPREAKQATMELSAPGPQALAHVSLRT